MFNGYLINFINKFNLLIKKNYCNIKVKYYRWLWVCSLDNCLDNLIKFGFYMNFFLVNICIYFFVDFYGGIYRFVIIKLLDDYVGVLDLYVYVDCDLLDFVFKVC